MPAERLLELVVRRLELLQHFHLPGLRPPGVLAGHQVGPAARADLAFTLALLADAGVESVAGVPVDEGVVRALRDLDGPATHSFFSYRVAEALRRWGPIDDNPLVARLGAGARANLDAATDSSGHVELLERGALPRNYAGVLLRCELAREALGLPVDAARVARLDERARALLGGYVDDAAGATGRYDVYTPESYIFTAPLGQRLGERWERGARHALGLVERTCATDGAAITWGRSTGALSVCLTAELGALGLRLGLVDPAGPWPALVERAADRVGAWFGLEGLIVAHQGRDPGPDRGPARRLQMTLDCLGKLAQAALHLRASPPPAPSAADPFPDRDAVVWFDEGRRAGVWTYRSRDLAFVLPLVGASAAEYVAAPRSPGLFETPADAELVTGVPVAFTHGVRYVGAGLPQAVERVPGGLRLAFRDLLHAGRLELAGAGSIPAQREVTIRVERRTLHVDERLRFEGRAPDALAVHVPEAAGRPLRVAFRCDAPHHATSVDVSGVAEWRSAWGPLPRVHQVDVTPASEVAIGWSVTPKLRVLTSDLPHPYHRRVYETLGDDVVERHLAGHEAADPDLLAGWDLFHLHWPESFLGADLERHHAVIAALRAAGVRIVWTQHNLVPHDKDPGLEEAYRAWAAAADGVVHHSEWGRARVLARRPYRPGAVHRVIPHVHFGLVERDPPGEALRLGVLGAPRAEKDVQAVLDAFAATSRDDLRLTVFSLDDERVPADPRIEAMPYVQVPRAQYERRLAGLDVAVLPFGDGGDMLTTGTAGDVVAAGLAALTSDWPFLHEALGAAAIPCGRTPADLRAALERLDRATVERAAAAAVALREERSPERIGAAHLELLEAVGTARL